MMMGKHWGYGLYLLFNIYIFFFFSTHVTINTCLGAAANVTSTVSCFEEERSALVQFKHGLTDRKGMLSSWIGKDCCSWERVGCDRNTGRVVKLDLRGDYSFLEQSERSLLLFMEYYLEGKVNSGLAELKHLTHLDLSYNDFEGSKIPKFMGSFKQLRYLNLSRSGFSGIIPHHLGNLSSLNILDVSGNYYDDSGLIADDVAWVTRLSSLQHLDLSYVDLGGAQNIDNLFRIIPSLAEVCLHECSLSNAQLTPNFHLNSSTTLPPKIQLLDLGFNSFEGPFPSFLHNMTTSLEFLDLSRYNLSNQPDSFGDFLNMFPSLSELHLLHCDLHNTHLSPTHLNFSLILSKIQHLDLSFNLFTGDFPSLLTNMSSLRSLDLSWNNLKSSIPVMKNLVQLDLAANGFHNIEQTGIWNQCHLKLLDLSANHFHAEMIGPSASVSKCIRFEFEVLHLRWNDFNGSIPESLARLTQLKELDLGDNSLTGPIPESLGRLTRLRKLHIGDNSLTGPIPVSLGKLTLLEELHLDSNKLTGPLPASLGCLKSLQVLSLYSNVLNGTIPVSLGQLTKLTVLDVSNNSLEGFVFETHFANLSLLKYLFLTSNTMLTFNISAEWKPPFQLTYLNLGSCKIGAEFPQWIRTQMNLSVLVLSNSSISGPLPTWLQDMSMISSLDLSHNLISGPLTNLPRNNLDEILLLRNNLFSGSIPQSLCNRTALQYLDISRNRLSGELPPCLEKLQDLGVMLLSSNSLSGVIPSSLGHLSSLIWLQLNNNTFHGELPISMANCTALQVLDLGENEFSGHIPKWLGKDITDLRVLRFHRNNFSGNIPGELCRNSYLQILDLSQNGLTGTIPRCFGEFVGMATALLGFGSNGTGVFERNVMVVMKGVVLEYTTTMGYVVNMDLSCNNLVGKIPNELTSRSGLIGLNLSHNRLTGGIPDRIGDMKALISLDLSVNKLAGTIPPSLADLTSLSYLNLSQNDLSGRIPTGPQLRTLLDPSIYGGNRELCGAPLPKNCSNDEDTTTGDNIERNEASDGPKKVWLYLDIMSGFATGFWGIIGVLLFKKHWRQELFRFVEATVDKIYVAVAVGVSKMKRGRGTT